jgi:hypothetical protein
MKIMSKPFYVETIRPFCVNKSIRIIERSKVNVHIEEVTRIVFHFNKHYLLDNTIPMWVVKAKGSTFYVNHLESSLGFITKETPDNEHTKGSIQFRGRLKIENGIATVY